MTPVGALLLSLPLLLLCAFFTAALVALGRVAPADALAPRARRNGDMTPAPRSSRSEAAAAPLDVRSGALASLHLGRAITVIGYAWLTLPALHHLLGGLLAQGAERPLLLSVATDAGVVAMALLGVSFLLTLATYGVARTVALSDPATALGRLERPIALWAIASRPLAAPIHALSSALLRSFVRSDAGSTGRSERLRRVLEANLHSGDLDEAERKLLLNLFVFSEATTGDVMAPRTDVEWIPTDLTLDEVLARVQRSGHTRFPVAEGTPDRVIGYLHAKDLEGFRGGIRPERFDIRKVVRPVAFVPESARVVTILRRFQEERSHLAVVVDEFGGMAGVVTLEDLLEELVGDIRDEFDVEEPDMQVLESGELLVDGAVRLEELEESLGLDFGEVEEDTVGGFIFGRFAREVQVGEEVEVGTATLRVEAVDGLRITLVRIAPEVRTPSSGVPEAEGVEPARSGTHAGPARDAADPLERHVDANGRRRTEIRYVTSGRHDG